MGRSERRGRRKRDGHARDAAERPAAPIARERSHTLRVRAVVLLATVAVLVVTTVGMVAATDRSAERVRAGRTAAATPGGGHASGGPVGARALADDDREMLREVFGIDDAARLYVPDDEPERVLRYRAMAPGCVVEGDSAPRRTGDLERDRACRAVAVRVGLTSPRRPDESWDAFVGRVRRGGTQAWPGGRHAYYTGLASLDPDARGAFEQLLVDARRAGFRVRVGETYRSPERQMLLLARGDGRTATATSVHSYGRAVDLVVGDGRIRRPATARAWIAFRRWVVRYRDGAFRVVGTPERTWDWPHVELATPVLGYASVEALLDAARACRDGTSDAAAAAARCTLVPKLPPHLAPASAGAAAAD